MSFFFQPKKLLKNFQIAALKKFVTFFFVELKFKTSGSFRNSFFLGWGNLF